MVPRSPSGWPISTRRSPICVRGRRECFSRMNIARRSTTRRPHRFWSGWPNRTRPASFTPAGLSGSAGSSLMRRAAAALGLPVSLVRSNRRADAPSTEPRPADVSLDTSLLQSIAARTGAAKDRGGLANQLTDTNRIHTCGLAKRFRRRSTLLGTLRESIWRCCLNDFLHEIRHKAVTRVAYRSSRQ